MSAINHMEKKERIWALEKQIRSLQTELGQLKAELAAEAEVEELIRFQENAPLEVLHSTLDQTSSSEDKVELFLSLFKGRPDVCAKRWKNKPGYSPYCANDFRPGVCGKPKIRCSECEVSEFVPLGPAQVRDHLMGRQVLGLYPLTKEDTCHLLAMDLDEAHWLEDAQVIRSVCRAAGIPVSLERSRSGNGGHLWWFFDEAVPAGLARKFGMALLDQAMAISASLSFASFDRFFPSQDILPRDGFGNLIALPLQKEARAQGNTVFLDEEGKVIEDQWAYLSGIDRVTIAQLEAIVQSHGAQYETDETAEAMPSRHPLVLDRSDFPPVLTIHREAGLMLSKEGMSAAAIHGLRRLASYGNPEFFARQAMRLSTYGIPRVTVVFEEDEKHLRLPRGTEAALLELLSATGVAHEILDERFRGRALNIAFKGELTPHQDAAFAAMTAHDCGVLAATTGFGKTVIGARIIAEKQCPTLVLVHTKELANQWKERLEQFLEIDEVLEKRRKGASIIGQLGGGKKNLHGIVDIALIQSLVDRDKAVKDAVHGYGLVIVDECHHISAVNFSRVLSEVDAATVYGLTATPIRKDGHHPIIFMQCGPVRYQVSAKGEAIKRSFSHAVIPRFTALRLPPIKAYDQWHITEVYERITADALRNELITQDVFRAVAEGRKPLVLTERTAHLELLKGSLQKKGLKVITLYGTMKAKERKEALRELKALGPEESFVLLATGRLIGEGFDEARLDTLFLAMPVAWKGTVAQYAGRLHRDFEGKEEVRIYDYVDVHIPVLERMYHKRLKAYASVGYQVKANSAGEGDAARIYDASDYRAALLADLRAATDSIILASPYPRSSQLKELKPLLQELFQSGRHITLCTRPAHETKAAWRSNVQGMQDELRQTGIHILTKSGFHLHYILLDERILWYGSLDPLGTGEPDDTLIRIEDPELAAEFLAMTDASEEQTKR